MPVHACTHQVSYCHRWVNLSTASTLGTFGKFRLQIWQEGYGFVQKSNKDRGIEIEIKGGKTTEVNRQLVESQDD